MLTTLGLSSCNMSDDYHELGSGYSYVGEGGNMNHISGGNVLDNTAIHGKVTRFNVDETFIIAEQKPDYEEYTSAVSTELGINYYKYHQYLTDSVNWKKDWSAADLHEVRRFKPLYDVLSGRGVSFDNTESDMLKCTAVADSLLRNEPYYRNIFKRQRNYWIINKQTGKGLGPYDLAQFSQQCKQSGINLKLEAHNVAID
ncbi:hypothetical protein LJ737_22470 [Hymenobacter sp. 15J16-1T3B]|nr:hypothetical protein [Hymenobacter sp. 15J16-1T3B]